MKTYEDVLERLRSELQHWQIKQRKDLFSDFYLYYLPSTTEHDGGLIICKKQPANPEYKLVTAERIKKECTLSENFRYFERLCRSIHILSIR